MIPNLYYKSFRILFILMAGAVLLFPLSTAFPETIEVPGGSAFLAGRRLQQSGEWEASIEQFRAAADVYSQVADYALYQVAQSAIQSGDTELAVASLENLLAHHPDTPVRRPARLDLANLYFSTGKEALASPLIQAILPSAQSTRETVELMLMLAKSYKAANDVSMFDTICWQLIHGWPTTAEALEAATMGSNIDSPQKRLAVAKVYFRNKKPDDALGIVEPLIENPDAADLMPDLLLLKAQTLEAKGQRDDASGLYDRIIAEYPTSSSTANAFFNRAEYKRSVGLPDEALEDYSHVVRQFPLHYLSPEALWKRAKIFEQIDEPNEYVEYAKIIRDYPRSSYAYSATMYWGLKLYRAGNYSEARDVFEKLLAADLNSDSNADASFWIGKCLIAEGKADAARIQLAGVIGRFEGTYQAFRAGSILRTLAEAQTLYTLREARDLQDMLAFDPGGAVSYEMNTPEEAYAAVAKELSHVSDEALGRLGFLMVNRLPEAEWELRELSSLATGPNAKYALAWAMFYARAYYDTIKAASSIRGQTPESKAERVQYLLYPVAYPEFVGLKASKYEIDPMLALAVMREESHFREKIVSGSDARGLMQILPSTGEWLAGKVFGPATFDRSLLFRPAMNIELGTYYLRYLLGRFDNNVAVAIVAYNWGETVLRKWMTNSPQSDLDVFVESIPVEEPRRYVKKVLRSYAMYRSLYPADFLQPEEL